jgi:hypothetical protein
VAAFIIGVALLISGLADFGGLGSSDILIVLSCPIAIIKIVVGVILTLATIEPNARAAMLMLKRFGFSVVWMF